jgi:hypothetical protein
MTAKQSKTTLIDVNKTFYDVYIGKPSLWSNRHIVGICTWCKRTHEDIKDTLRYYKIDFLMDLKNPVFANEVEALRGKRLGCTCPTWQTGICHGEIILYHLEPELTKALSSSTPSVSSIG